MSFHARTVCRSSSEIIRKPSLSIKATEEPQTNPVRGFARTGHMEARAHGWMEVSNVTMAENSMAIVVNPSKHANPTVPR